jgi:hypothetical protein
MLGPFPWLAGNSRETMREHLLLILWLPIILAVVIGKGFAKLDFWSSKLSLPPGIAVSPIDNFTLVTAKLKAGAFSVLVAWGLVMVAAPLWLILWGDTNGLVQRWQEWQRDYAAYSPWGTGLAVGLALLAGMLLTWKFLVQSAYLGMYGRPGMFLSGVALSMAYYAGLIYGVWWFFNQQENSKWLVDHLPGLLGSLVLAFGLKVWLGIWAFSKAHRHGLLSARAVGIYWVFWGVATGCLAVLPYLLFPFRPWLWHLLAFGSCLLVPLARIGLLPLAAAANRR